MAHSRYWPTSLALVVLLLAGCSASAADDPSLEGVWLLESFSEDGEHHQVQVDVNAPEQPWVEILETKMAGNAGCNGFGSTGKDSYIYQDGILVPGETAFNASLCMSEDGNDLMKVENLLTDVLWRYPEGIEVETIDDQMIWRAGNIELFFRSTPAPPVRPPPPSPTSIGRLDCSPGVVAEERIANDVLSTEQILLDSVPEVVRTEEDPEFSPPAPADWFWWGYDENDTLIAFIARGDVEPPEYQVFTCIND